MGDFSNLGTNGTNWAPYANEPSEFGSVTASEPSFTPLHPEWMPAYGFQDPSASEIESEWYKTNSNTKEAGAAIKWDLQIEQFFSSFGDFKKLYEVAWQTEDDDNRRIQLANLNTPANMLIALGRKILNEPPAFYNFNAEKVRQVGAVFDSVVEMSQHTANAFHKVRSDDNSVTNGIIKELEKATIDRGDSIQKGVDTLPGAIKDIGETAKKLAFPIGLGIAALVVLVVFVKR